MKTGFDVKDQRFAIKRYPLDPSEKLQAWNAADELMIDFIQSEKINDKTRVLIINDQFGYLAVHSTTFIATVLVDRKSSLFAIEENCKENKRKNPKLQTITGKLSGKFDLVLIQMPKSIDLLDLYLSLINDHLINKSIVICGFMTRHFTPNYLKTFQKYFQQVDQSKAQKKARLILAKQAKKSDFVSKKFEYKVDFNQETLTIHSQAGVFSARKIDKGSKFLLQHFPEVEAKSTVLDLGSGSGLLGLAAFSAQKSIQLIAVDDSFLAIEACKLTLESVPNKTLICGYDLSEITDESIDLILSNLPFHSGHATNQNVALRLISDARRVLKQNHEFRFVANRHLGLDNYLQSNFQKVRQIAENHSYRIWSCLK